MTTNYFFLGQLVDRVHLEFTNKCVLACSKCSRTGSEVIKRKGNLSLSALKKVIQPNSSIKQATICGNYGDAIYHPSFHELLFYIKSCGVKIDLTTNGSHWHERFWQETADIMGPKDRITFSIDGLEDTNHLYRKNSKWNSVMLGVKTMVGKTRVRWKTIVFRHNEHQVEAIKEYAQKMGVDEIRINKSSRFKVDKEDMLKPKNPEWIGLRSKNQTEIKRFLKRGDIDSLKEKVIIKPQCTSGKEIFISFDGKVYPCCACAMHETSSYASWFGGLESQNSLENHSLSEILSNPIWQELQGTWVFPSHRSPLSCFKRCGVFQDFQSLLPRDEMIAKPKQDNIKIRLRK